MFTTHSSPRCLCIRLSALYAPFRVGILLFGMLSSATPLLAQNPPVSGTPTDAVPAATAVKAKRLFDEAVAHQKAGRTAQAVIAYKQMLQLLPRSYPACMNLGLLYQQTGKPADAEQMYRQAAAAEPKNALPHVQLAGLLSSQKRLGEAKNAALKAVTLDPKNAQAHFALGGIYGAFQQLPDAEKEFREAARLAPDNAQAFFNLGVTLATQKKQADALRAFEQAVKLDPKLGQAWLYLGVTQMELGSPKSALAAYQRAAAVLPDNHTALFNSGVAYERMADDAAKTAPNLIEERKSQERLRGLAISSYLNAIAKAPRWLPPRVNVGRLYFGLPNYGQAVVHFRAAAALEPKNMAILSDLALAEANAGREVTDSRRLPLLKSAEAHFQQLLATAPTLGAFRGLASLYEMQGQNDKAGDVYEKMLARFPQETASVLALARFRESQKRPDDALKLYQQAVLARPKDASLRVTLAHFYLYSAKNAPDYLHADEQLREAAVLAPNNMEVLRERATLLSQQKKPEEAVAVYETMKRLAPKDPAPVLALANLYEQQNRPDNALREYRGLVALDPQNVSAHWSLARAFEAQKKFDEALNEYSIMQTLAPRDPLPTMNRARIFQSLGKPQAVLDLYRQAKERDPANIQWRTLYAETLEIQGKPDDARAEYEALLTLVPENSAARLHLARLFRQSKKWDEARAGYLKVLEVQPTNTEALNGLAAIYDEEKRPEAWIAFLEAQIRRAPTQTGLLPVYEEASVRAKRQTEMLTFLKDVNATVPPNRDFLNAYAALLNRQGKTDAALDVFRRITRLSPDDYALRTLIGKQYAATNRIPEAIQVYEEIILMKGVPVATLTETRIAVALLYERNGQNALALAQYREVLRVEPKNTTALDGMKRLGG